VLENCEHADPSNCLTVRAQVIAEFAEHQTHSPVRRLRRKSRINADAARDAIAKDTEQGVVRAADVEDARPLRDVRCGLRDTPALRRTIEELH